MYKDRTKPYRCQLPEDDCKCRIRVGRQSVECQIIDLSREDFRLKVPKSLAKSLRKSKHIVLHFHGERWSVRFNQLMTEQEEDGIVVLDRIEELTPVKMPSPWTTLFSLQMSRNTDPRFLLALMVAFIVVCLALPGVGDKLGTAPRIKNGVDTFLRSFN